MSEPQDASSQTKELRNEGPLTETQDIPSTALYTRQREYLQTATAENTRRAYRAAIRHFERWGRRLPTTRETLIGYLLAYAETLNPRTLAVGLTALSQWRRSQGLADPAGRPSGA